MEKTRCIHPTFGRVPSAARWVYMELGLLVFRAGVRLRAGSGILDTLATSRPGLFAAGVLVTSIPVLAGFVLGRWVLRLNPVLLLGAITGFMSSGAALSIVNRGATKNSNCGRQSRSAEWGEGREFRSERRKCLDAEVFDMLARC